MIRAYLREGTDAAGLRSRSGISIRTVARALGVTGVTVWKWEHRRTVPTGAKGAAYVRFIAGLARHEAAAVDAEERETA